MTSSILSNLTIMHGGRKKSATIWVRWSPPCQGWTTLNSEGCTKREFNQAGGGGLPGDHQGRWICEFSVRFGRCSAVEEELWAQIQGLRIAWEKGIHNLTAETDSLLVHTWLTTMIASSTPVIDPSQKQGNKQQ